MRAGCVAPSQKYGKKLQMHANESFFRQMAEQLGTPEGREVRRERVQVEHALARVSQIQGNRATFKGRAKNQFDLERVGVVKNLLVLSRLLPMAA